jgi:hypothetical protein
MVMSLGSTISAMGMDYLLDPVKAVRSQSFIKILHTYLHGDLNARLTPFAKQRGIAVRDEVKLLGSHKPKDVDVALVDPDNGPLMTIGVRSQMSSIGKNVLNYYEGIIGECISLQDRFPMAVHGYVYLMPLKPIKAGKESESIDFVRFARMYAAITGRSGQDYSSIRGIYDQFAYMVVDFDASALADHVYQPSIVADLSIETFLDRMITTFKERMLFWDIFI